MSRPAHVFFALILALLAFDGVAQVPPAPYEPPQTILKQDAVYDVRADGTYTVDSFMSLRINNQQGVQGSGQMKLPYSTTLQDMEVLEAYTLGKDGKRTDVAADKILVQQSPQSAGAPMFDDAKVKNIVFSAVEPGVTLNFRTRMTQKIPLFPGAFSMGQIFPRVIDYKAASVTVFAPETMKLFVDAVDLAGGEVKSERPGAKMWRWTLENPKLHLPEPGSVDATDYSPRVFMTSFPSYADAAKAYLDRARPKAAVTPAIQKLADQITGGITDKRAQAEALYRWVSKEIRYVGIYLGFGGVVPHASDEIAQARYGDCKDHVTILEALLAAKGIQSSTVLVNAAGSYALPKAAITPGLFNHVITYLPEFKLYVDSTAGMAPFGVLPFQELGKSALITDDGTGQARIAALPMANAQQDRVQVVTKVQVTPEGTIEGGSSIVNSGVYELIARQVFSGIPKGAEALVAAQLLSRAGQPGTGTFKFGDARDLTRPFAYTSQFASPNYAQMPGPGALRVPAGLGSFSGIAGIVRSLGQEKRDFPVAVEGGFEEEITTLTFPETVKITALPKAVMKENALGKYTAVYSQEGATITVKRTLDHKLTKATLSPDDYRLYRELGEAVYRDFRSQILYQ
ncbi:MAG: DUF3857 domain-containing protein [Betaproteobacteria bacterium]|nr:DUF3857 domain-containing protein [Betaproteobacteria bacterium]